MQANYKLFASLRLAVNLHAPAPPPAANTAPGIQGPAANAAPGIHGPAAKAATGAAVPSSTSLFISQTYRGGGRDAERLTRESGATLRLLSERLREATREATAERSLLTERSLLKVQLDGRGLAAAWLAATSPGARSNQRAASGAAHLVRSYRLPGAGLRWLQSFNEKLVPAPLSPGVGLSLSPGVGLSLSSGVGLSLSSGVALSPLALSRSSARDAWRHGWTVISLSPVLRQQGALVSFRDDVRRGVAAWHTLLSTQVGAAPEAAPGFVSTLFLNAASARHAAASREGAPTTIHLTFAAPKQPTAEGGARQLSRFGPAPPLQYVRQSAPAASGGVAEALRDLRQALGEMKAPAAAPAPQQVQQMTRQIISQLERELRIEKERRGL